MNLFVKVCQQQDSRFLKAAARLARRNQGVTGTNPSVSCVLVQQGTDGPVIVGAGVTAPGGRPHAEPFALAEAGDRARGATAYVTLEPCAHHGKTPPCAQTLIDAGVARVVTAVGDPDARVDGKGHAMLREAGVEVSVHDKDQGAVRTMKGYLSARRTGRPAVTLKLAISEEGIMGVRQRGNLRITGQASWRQVHLMRARHHAILVGSGTVLADDPDLSCRLPGLGHRSPVRVILDPDKQLTASHKVVETAGRVRTWVVSSPEPMGDWHAALERSGVQHLACEIIDGNVSLPELLDDLSALGIQSIMVEGGARVAAGFLADRLVDDVVIAVGGEPEKPASGEEPVIAPVCADAPPEGFDLADTLQFGADRWMLFEKRPA